MIEGVLDALAQRLGDAGHRFPAERASDGVSSKRKGQSRNFLPPPAKIDYAVQSGFVIRELGFVDDEAGFVFAFENLRDDLVEGDNFHLNAGREQFESQVSGGELPWHRNFLLLNVIRCKGPGGNEHGTITVAHAAAARHQRVFFLNVREGMERNRGYIVNAFLRLAIQRLDVTKGMAEL